MTRSGTAFALTLGTYCIIYTRVNGHPIKYIVLNLYLDQGIYTITGPAVMSERDVVYLTKVNQKNKLKEKDLSLISNLFTDFLYYEI